MALWKVLGGKARAVEETTFKEQQILESGIEDWVESSPGLLGEPLLIIGRQVVIHDLNDRIDLLALDPEGNVVVVEVKREDITAPVDIQAARYASYVSNWKPLDLERVWAEYANDGDPERTLEASFAEFVESVGADEDTTLNRNQRLLIVGQRVRNRLGSVALWLREQGVDIKLVELHPFLDGEELYIEPLVIIPPPSTEKWERVGQRDDTDSKPWLTDGKGWHSQRGGAEALERTQALTGALELAGVVHSVSYNQKHYVGVRDEKRIWLYVRPRPTQLRMDTRHFDVDIDLDGIAARLGLVRLDAAPDLKEKLALPSSVSIREKKGRRQLILRLKLDYDVTSEKLITFLTEVAEGKL